MEGSPRDVIVTCPLYHSRASARKMASSKSFFQLCRQETPNSVGGRRPLYQIQAAVAMEQQQIRLDTISIAEAGPCFGTRSKAMFSHQDLTPEPHSRTPKRISQDRQRRTNNSQQNFHAGTSNAEHLQDLYARTSSGGFQQDLYKIFSQRHLQD